MLSLAAEIAAWYENEFKPSHGGSPYAVVMMPSNFPHVPTMLQPAASREVAIAMMRSIPRPTLDGAYLAIIGPWGMEGTRA
jgi:hypothetical protein